jgi:hypothetical protein
MPLPSTMKVSGTPLPPVNCGASAGIGANGGEGLAKVPRSAWHFRGCLVVYAIGRMSIFWKFHEEDARGGRAHHGQIFTTETPPV